MTVNLAPLAAQLVLVAATIYIGWGVVGPNAHLNRTGRNLVVFAFVPTGSALAQVAGGGVRIVLALLLAAGVAACHRLARGPVDIILGAAAVLASFRELAGGTWCREPLGLAGWMVVLVLCAAAWSSAAARTGGADAARRLGTAVVAVAAASQLAAFTIGNIGGVALALPAFQRGTGLALLAAVLAALLVRTRSTPGLAVLGVALVASGMALTLTSGVCRQEAVTPLVIALTFAVVATVLSRSATPAPTPL